MKHSHIVVTVLCEDIFDTHTSCNTCVVVIKAQHDLSDVLVYLQPMKDGTLGYGAQRHVGMRCPVLLMKGDKRKHIDGSLEDKEPFAFAVMVEAVFRFAS